MSELEEILIEEDELEALRLSDANGLDQTSAAKRMKISQPTFARILALARKKLASAIVNGAAIRLGDSNKEKIGK